MCLSCALNHLLTYYLLRLGNSLSQPISVLNGVPQGSVIGPTLFLLFVYDVIDMFDNLAVSFKLYANDIKLYSCYNIISSCDDLSVAINRLYDWSVTWQLTIAVLHVRSTQPSTLRGTVK